LALSKRVLRNMVLRSRSQRQAGQAILPSAHSPSTAAPSTLTLSGHEHESTQILLEEEAQLAFERELQSEQILSGRVAGYDPDQANIELLSQTRIMPHRGESSMEHLLELRTAVNGLTILGRPEGAARLLEEHIAADPGTCAWAYLQYMHLCEQLELRDDFESMRKQYRQQFNRMAPYWHEPNANVLGLDGYARAANELCTAWSQGSQQAHQILASWLAGPLLARKLVQLPAYQDLFDLYEILELIQLDEQAASISPPAIESHQAADDAESSGHSLDVFETDDEHAAQQDFVPTVSLLDLDYEFSSDVTLQEREVQEAEKAVTTVKTGNFSVDFNVAGTQMGDLTSRPAELSKK
jgi:hypothetical protein